MAYIIIGIILVVVIWLGYKRAKNWEKEDGGDGVDL